MASTAYSPAFQERHWTTRDRGSFPQDTILLVVFRSADQSIVAKVSLFRSHRPGFSSEIISAIDTTACFLT